MHGFQNDLYAAGEVAPRNVNDSTTRQCMEFPAEPRLDATVETYRTSTKPPGARYRHPGMAPDYAHGGALEDIEERAFGMPGVEDNAWRTQALPGEAQQMLLTAKEKIYYSHRREVLGKTYMRGYDLPKSDDPRGIAYGKSTATTDTNRVTGKSMITPAATDAQAPINEEQEAFKQQYIKSHNSYDPQEQVSRGYEWPASIRDPHNFTFGVGVGAHKSLNFVSPNMTALLQEPPGPRVALKSTEGARALKDQLGRCKNLMQSEGRKDLPSAHVFGKTNRIKDQWDGGQVIHGDYSAAEQMPDPDIGTTLQPGFRPDASFVPGGVGRAFGTPNVRSDKPKPARRSIADNQNWGDDVNARYLLQPPQSAAYGITDDDYLELRPKVEVLQIFMVGSPGDYPLFEEAWARARGVGEGEGKRVSVSEFQVALNALQEREAREPI